MRRNFISVLLQDHSLSLVSVLHIGCKFHVFSFLASLQIYLSVIHSCALVRKPYLLFLWSWWVNSVTWKFSPIIFPSCQIHCAFYSQWRNVSFPLFRFTLFLAWVSYTLLPSEILSHHSSASLSSNPYWIFNPRVPNIWELICFTTVNIWFY